MNAAREDHTQYRRIAIVDTVANQPADETALCEDLRLIERMYGSNFVAYVFTRDASRTSMHIRMQNVIPIDYMHKITEECDHDVQKIRNRHDELMYYQPGNGNPSLDSIHSILSTVDILHIVGGDALSDSSPEMLEEIYTLVSLSKHYGARCLATGISAHLQNDECAERLIAIIDMCDIVDFRDKSADELIERFPEAHLADKMQITTDDALWYGKNARVSHHTSIPADVFSIQHKRYACVCVQSSTVSKPSAASKIIQRAAAYIEEGIIESVMLLALDSNNRDAYEVYLKEVGGASEHFTVVNLSEVDSYTAWFIVAHSTMNITTQYRQSVFSLATSIPTYSLATSKDAFFDLSAIHDVFGSTHYSLDSDFASADLDSFASSLQAQADALHASVLAVQKSWYNKIQAMCKVYADDDAAIDTLYARASSPRPIKVSVIISLHNDELYLGQCLDSVLSQNIDDMEVLCVDDGSTDATPRILCSYATNDPRISILSQGNLGVCAARNAGLQKAVGEFVFFIDPRDWLPSNSTLSALYWAAKEHNALASFGSAILVSDENPDEPNENGIDPASIFDHHQEGVVSYRELQIDCGLSRFMYDRSYLVSNALWFETGRHYEESEWLIRVLHTMEKFYAIDAPACCRRTDTNEQELSYDEAVSLVDGLRSNLLFAQEHGYDKLWALTNWRMIHDFASVIAPHLAGDAQDDRLDIAMEEYTQAVVAGGGTRGTVRQMLNNYYKELIAKAELTQKDLADAEAKGFKAGVSAVASDLAAAEGRGFQIGVKTLESEVAAAEDRSYRAGYAAAQPDIVAAEDRGYKAGFSLAESDLAAAEARGFKAGSNEIRNSNTYRIGHLFTALPRKLKKGLSSVRRK